LDDLAVFYCRVWREKEEMKRTIKMPKDEFQNLIDISHGCKYSSANRNRKIRQRKNQAKVERKKITVL
jgi:hypothetical protein